VDAQAQRLPPHHRACYGCGTENPAAMPLRFERNSERVHSEVVFGTTHAGAPGYAHGGAVATAFDDAFGTLLLAVIDEVGVTARLEVDYRRPVVLDVPLRLDVWIARREGRKVYPMGVLLEGEELMAEASGLFVIVHDDHFPTPASEWLALRSSGDPGLAR
jgi:acyl-coenzyme A thioesterase PaaI-like protein